MRKFAAKIMALLACGALSTMLAGSALAEEWPLAEGDYWSVTGIYVKDGGDLKYATYLTGEWRKNQEFAKSKGWIKSYMVLANVSPRSGEPSLYLITTFESVVSGAEDEKRAKEYDAWSKKTNELLQTESGNRAQFREVKSNLLLQEMKFRN